VEPPAPVDTPRNTTLTNFPWGDSIATDLKPSGSLCIYFQNINGILYNSRTEKTHNIAESLLQKDVEILGLAETNLDWHHPISNEVRQAFTHRFKNVHFTHSSSHHALQPNQSIDLCPCSFQPGGLALPTSSLANMSAASKPLHRHP
jgi:hypothetical protein